MIQTAKEIAEQSTVIRGLLDQETENVKRIAAAVREFNPAFIMIAARGTSDNAARYAQYMLGIHARMPVALATPSIHTLYDAPPDLSRALVIGISQSGQSRDVGRVVRDAREQGALTLNITNDENSPMAQNADHHLSLHCGEEIAVAATKTYTAELTAIAMLTAALVDDAGLIASLPLLPDHIQETLTRSADIGSWVQRYRYVERIAVIARGYNYCTAFEISLKIKELCGITGEQYSEADFLHGPIAVIERGFPVVVVAPRGKTMARLVELLEKLKRKQAECLIVSNQDSLAAMGQVYMPIPQTTPEWLSPICAVIPGQIFAMHLANTKGLSVDKPRALTKVTITE